jgi:hypothetical protein
VGIALRLADLGVAEDLLDDADVDALSEQEGRGGMAGVVHADPPDAGLLQQRQPVVPVGLGGEGLAGGRAEHKVQVCPGVSGRLPFRVLRLVVGAKLIGEWLRDRED